VVWFKCNYKNWIALHAKNVPRSTLSHAYKATKQMQSILKQPWLTLRLLKLHGADVVEWSRALFKSHRGKNKLFTAQKTNSNTVWFNFQTYIGLYIYIYIYKWGTCHGCLRIYYIKVWCDLNVIIRIESRFMQKMCLGPRFHTPTKLQNKCNQFLNNHGMYLIYIYIYIYIGLRYSLRNKVTLRLLKLHGADVVEWSRALFKSHRGKNKLFTAQKTNSNTVWFKSNSAIFNILYRIMKNSLYSHRK
jgi:hypothetical protein